MRYKTTNWVYTSRKEKKHDVHPNIIHFPNKFIARRLIISRYLFYVSYSRTTIRNNVYKLNERVIYGGV